MGFGIPACSAGVNMWCVYSEINHNKGLITLRMPITLTILAKVFRIVFCCFGNYREKSIIIHSPLK